MGDAAELVRVGLSGLILERVGVHGVEAEAETFAVLAQRIDIAHTIPWKMQRDRRRRAGELLDHRAVLELVEDVARLARAGEAREARAARAHAPRRQSDAELADARGDALDVEIAPAERAAECLVILLQRRQGGLVLCGDERLLDRKLCHGHVSFDSQATRGRPVGTHRVNEGPWPPSTLRMLPVDFAERSEAKKWTASAMSSG